jgi:probable F420-dependent oxidoreductase
MEIGVFLPISGRAAGPETLTEAARTAERLGFDAVWSADRVVTPWRIETPYPYAEGDAFIVPPDRPFLDSMACLAFLAGRTERVRLGISVMVLPYRHPLYWTRLAATIDRLSAGRLIMGVGVGWMREEFEALGVPFEPRGRMTDEQLEAARILFTQDHCSFHGQHYAFSDVSSFPRPDPHLPIWVGGEGRAARRRAGRYGNAWFPYFVRTTPERLQELHQEVRAAARDAGRNPDEVALTCCAAIEVTKHEVEQDPSRLRGSPEQLMAALAGYQRAGVEHVALQFTAPRWPDRLAQIQAFGSEVLPRLR